MDLGEDPDGCTGLRRREGGTLTGEAGSDYEHVVLGHAGGDSMQCTSDYGVRRYGVRIP